MNQTNVTTTTPHISWTEFENVHGKKIEFYSDDIDNFVAHLAKAKAPSKEKCRLLSPVDFGENKSKNGSYRHDANVIGIDGVIGDYDDGMVPIEDAQKMLEANDIIAVLYSTPSSTQNKPRWRVICQTSKTYPTAKHKPLTEFLNRHLGDILAKESFTLSQTFYYGDVGTNDYKVIKTKGTKYIDQVEMLDEQVLKEVKQTKLEILSVSLEPFLAPALLNDLRSALGVIPSDERSMWIQIGHALKTIGEVGKTLWMEWSFKSSKFDPLDAQRCWTSFNPQQTSYQVVFAEAQRLGWVNPLKIERPIEDEISLRFDEFENLRINLLEIDSSDDEPLPHVVDKWIPENEVALLGGHGGGGKSMVALSLGIHVALGLSFGGLTTKQTNVAFYSAEDSGRVLRHRFRKICREHLIDPKQLDGKLHLLDVSDIDPTLHRGSSFSNSKTETTSLSYLSQYVKKYNIGFCIIDNASDTFDDEEIKRKPVRDFMRSIRTRIARPNRAVLLLAHINKANARGGRLADTEDYSGSTAWHNSVRSRLSLSSDKASGLMTITHQKANLGELAEPITFEWINGIPLTGVKNPEREAQAIVLKVNEKARDIRDKKTLAEIIQKLTNRGEYVGTSATSAYSTYNLLKVDTDFPKVLDTDRFKRLIGEMQEEQIITRKIIKTPSRKTKEVFITVAQMFAVEPTLTSSETGDKHYD
jgi:archaellum biogenesis ATPase FlaH